VNGNDQGTEDDFQITHIPVLTSGERSHRGFDKFEGFSKY
jgi:hypothetical protein